MVEVILMDIILKREKRGVYSGLRSPKIQFVILGKRPAISQRKMNISIGSAQLIKPVQDNTLKHPSSIKHMILLVRLFSLVLYYLRHIHPHGVIYKIPRQYVLFKIFNATNFIHFQIHRESRQNLKLLIQPRPQSHLDG